MTRSFRQLATGALMIAAGVAGCAHCDTCDDFPVPCYGPNCGTSPAMSSYAPGPGPMMSPGPGVAAGAFSAPPSSTANMPGMAMPALPNVPADTPPPAPPAAEPPAKP